MNKIYWEISQNSLEKIQINNLKNNNILLTGANGLIGSHIANLIGLANKELNSNINLTMISKSEPVPWIQELLDDKKLSFVQADLENENDFTKFNNESYQCIIHGATYGQPGKFLANKIGTMDLNSRITKNLLDLAAKNKSAFLFMSSSEVYGNLLNSNQLGRPIKESDPSVFSVLDRRATYITSKLFSESLCLSYGESFGLNVKIARVSSASGPGYKLIDDRVLYVFIKRALMEKQIKLMDRGEQKRNWLFIGDALVMFFNMLTSGKDIIYNVSGSEQKSIAEMAHQIGNILGVPVSIPEMNNNESHTVGAPTLISIDNSKIVSEFGLSKMSDSGQWLRYCCDWSKYLME